MSSIKKADPQQRMTNMLLAGNLYKAHKIDKGIQKISQIQQAAMKQNMQMHQQTTAQNREIIANQNAANQIAQSQLRMQLSQAQFLLAQKNLQPHHAVFAGSLSLITTQRDGSACQLLRQFMEK